MVLILSFWVNLDGWVIGIIEELCKICKIFYVLNFIKFYMYILYFSLLYIYLIFGCIVIIGILYVEIIKSMERKSKVYLYICEENCFKFVKVNVRVEIVVL